MVSGVQDEAAQVLVAALNHELGNTGRTLELSTPSLQKQATDGEMSRLVEEMNEGAVQALLLYGVNPVYDYAEPERFRRGLERTALHDDRRVPVIGLHAGAHGAQRLGDPLHRPG